jgi:hypothetical protein
MRLRFRKGRSKQKMCAQSEMAAWSQLDDLGFFHQCAGAVEPSDPIPNGELAFGGQKVVPVAAAGSDKGVPSVISRNA